jgi:hypothetical protein
MFAPARAIIVLLPNLLYFDLSINISKSNSENSKPVISFSLYRSVGYLIS